LRDDNQGRLGLLEVAAMLGNTEREDAACANWEEPIVKDLSRLPEIWDALAHFSNEGRIPNVLEDHYLLTLASFFALPLQKHSKEACARLLLMCYPTTSRPLPSVPDVLRFITERTFLLDNFQDPELSLLLWQLRGICLHRIEINHQLIQNIEKGGLMASHYLLKSAHTVQKGLEISTRVVCWGIKEAGNQIKRIIPPAKTPLLEASPTARLRSLEYFDAAKLRSDSINESSREAMAKILSSSTQFVSDLSHRSRSSNVGEKLMPNEKARTIVCVVGRVAIVGVGASALVAESLVQSTGQLTKTTVAVAADLIEHRYGLSAGNFVKNSHKVVGNFQETFGRATVLINGWAMTKKVANYTTKMHVQIIEKPNLLDESEHITRSSNLFEAVEGGIFLLDHPLQKDNNSDTEEHRSPLQFSNDNNGGREIKSIVSSESNFETSKSRTPSYESPHEHVG